MATNLVLLGRTGTGKSTTGNSILGREAFESGFGSNSCTHDCQLQSTTINGRTVNVIDTPGLFDTNIPNVSIAKEIAKCIKLAKDGLHGVLLVLSLRNRYSPEEAQVIDILQILFGPRIINYIVVVFTHGDALEKKNMTLEKYLEKSPTGLKDLLRRCNDRKIVFNNEADPEKQKANVMKLLNQIDKIIEQEGKPYSDNMFREFKDMSDALLRQKEQRGSGSDAVVAMTEALTRVTLMVHERLEKAIAKLEEQVDTEREKRIAVQIELEKIKNKPKDDGGSCCIL